MSTIQTAPMTNIQTAQNAYINATALAVSALQAWETIKGKEGSTKAMYCYLELHGRELAYRSAYRAALAA